MAFIQTGPILTRLREVLEESAGSIRTVPVDRFQGDLPSGLDPNEENRRAMEKPRVEASITRVEPHPQTPPETGNLHLLRIGVQVRLIRLMSRDEQLTDATRDTLRALAYEDADVVRQALGRHQNLRQTAAGTATDIVTGLLMYVATTFTISGAINEGAQTFESIHEFTGTVISRPATS